MSSLSSGSSESIHILESSTMHTLDDQPSGSGMAEVPGLTLFVMGCIAAKWMGVKRRVISARTAR